MLVLRYDDVNDILEGQEKALVELVRDTYRRHDRGDSIVPHSVFLRFPEGRPDRVIGLPAYLGDRADSDGTDSGGEVAGIKWVSSFPGNIHSGLPRAHAAIILNSATTGRPEALIEGSVISARRTAASGALAASMLTETSGVNGVGGVTLIGCGVINLELLRFLRAVLPVSRQVTVFDRDPERARAFLRRARELVPEATFSVASDLASAKAAGGLLAIATTATEPHMDLEGCPPGSTVLHISLRDLFPETILRSHNVVDDPDHVCREGTSLHRAERLTGNRDFIDASLGRLIREDAARRWSRDRPVVFSPFGLGVLDIAFAEYVRAAAVQSGAGIPVDDFLPVAASG